MTSPETISSTDLVAALDTAMNEYREQIKTARKQREIDISSPWGAELDQLNRDWSKFNAAHQAKIQPQREIYIARRRELLDNIAEYRKDHPKPQPAATRGRPKFEYNDAIKLAAYRLFLARGKSIVRAVMGGNLNALSLNTLLAEGKDLHEAQLATEGEW